MISSLFRELRAFLAGNRLETFPLRRTLRGYRGEDLLADARAGLNVALLALPQGMAYAVVADLPLHYGITCSAAAALAAPFFAASRHTILGPTNATAFLMFSVFGGMSAAARLELMPLLVLMTGMFLVLGAYLRLADLIQYVSRSVIVGYVAGAAVLITVNQLRHVLGIDELLKGDMEGGEGAQTFFGLSVAILTHVGQVRWEPLAAAGATVLCYEVGRRFLRGYAFPLTLAGITLGTAVLRRHTDFDISRFDGFSAGSLLPVWPNFGGGGIFDQVHSVMGVALALAFLASLENSVMSRTLASHTGDRPDQNQDMLSAGVANLAAAFVSGMAASGSLTRSALNYASGAVTGLSSMVSGLLCLAGALLLGPWVSEVPKSCLAALVICVALTLISRKSLRVCLTATRSDAAVVAVTFFSALLAPLHVAVVLGAATSVALYLQKASRPYLAEYEFDQEGRLLERDRERERQNPAISIVHVEGDLFFGAAELFRNQIQRISEDPNLRVIVLRMRNARLLDATSVVALEDLIRFLRARGRALLISGVGPEILRVLRNSGLLAVLDDDPPEWRTEERDRNVFLNDPRNPNLSTRDALKRAQQILGTTQAEIRIFYDAAKPRGEKGKN